MRLSTAALFALTAAACHPKPIASSCEVNTDCDSGQACVEATCVKLCLRDNECEAGFACEQGVCATCDSCRFPPHVTNVDGTGSADDRGGTYAAHRLHSTLVISGDHLEGASVLLSGQGRTNQLLTPCAAATAERLEVELPADIGTGAYTLAVANAAGSCDAQVNLLQGEQGEQGPLGGYTIGAGLHLDGDELSLQLPAGLIFEYAGATIPDGWLPCDGSAVSRSTFSGLFAAIGTTGGPGDGTTTFNLPDKRGRTGIGDGTGANQETCATSAGNGFTVVANSTKWITGQPVVLSALSGFTTTATAGPTYFVSRMSSTNIRLATTLAAAQGGAPNITISGSGTVTITSNLSARTLGESGGEETHAMSSGELLAHQHGLANVVGGGAAEPYNIGSGSDAQMNSGGATGVAGGNAAMNIVQPFVVVKYIISY